MTEAMLIAILKDSIMVMAMIAGPIVLVSLVVGLLISVFQATTQIQEQTLTFVPKLISIGIILLFMAPYFLSIMKGYFERITDYIGMIS